MGLLLESSLPTPLEYVGTQKPEGTGDGGRQSRMYIANPMTSIEAALAVEMTQAHCLSSSSGVGVWASVTL